MNESLHQQLNKEEPMEDITAKLRETFREEAYELISELEAALLELEKSPYDEEPIGRAFRALHTIKGSGAACELNDISAFTHELETLFDKVRRGQLIVTKDIIALTLSAHDQIKAMFDQCYKGGQVDGAKTREIIDAVWKLASPAQTGDAPPVLKRRNAGSARGSSVTYWIRFSPARDIFTRGINPLFLLGELSQLGPCKVIARTDAVPRLEEYEPEACYTYWDVLLTTSQGLNAVQDVFIFVEDESELRIELIDTEGALEDEATYKKIHELFLKHKDLSPEDIRAALKPENTVSESAGRAPLCAEQTGTDTREQSQDANRPSSIRVATDRLDSLVNLVGELVTVQARLSQTANTHGIPEFTSLAETIERLTSEIRDNTMSIRMLPIGATFTKLQRVVRDLSAELGKELELTIDGAETELDKTVIERLSDPLVHIIRNSIDHGIETPEVRVSSGKPRAGSIRVSAAHSGANVLIRIEDDGAGIDCEAVRAKAIEKKLIEPDAELSEKELLSFILRPAFSTANGVSNVSGRGVGMDVVKKAIDALRGTIELSSEQGKGTTILLKLPLTLAIIDGFLTKIGTESFIFPLSFVEECLELTHETGAGPNSRHLVNVRDRLVPYIRLREKFMMGGEPPEIEQIVIVREDGQRVGFVVDQVVGGHQTVIKNLGKFYRDVEGISGATIQGDGTVALILDVPKLIQAAELEAIGVSS